MSGNCKHAGPKQTKIGRPRDGWKQRHGEVCDGEWGEVK